MRSYEIDGRKYISINGKTFFLLRGYCVHYDKYVFVQVYGTAPLTKDDLPEKNWQVITTKAQGKKVYTAYKPGYFDGTNETQIFIGVTRDAALRALLASRLAPVDLDGAMPRFIVETRYEGDHGIPYDSGISVLDDKGSSGVPALTIGETYRFAAFLMKGRKEEPCPQ